MAQPVDQGVMQEVSVVSHCRRCAARVGKKQIANNGAPQVDTSRSRALCLLQLPWSSAQVWSILHYNVRTGGSMHCNKNGDWCLVTLDMLRRLATGSMVGVEGAKAVAEACASSPVLRSFSFRGTLTPAPSPRPAMWMALAS